MELKFRWKEVDFVLMVGFLSIFYGISLFLGIWLGLFYHFENGLRITLPGDFPVLKAYLLVLLIIYPVLLIILYFFPKIGTFLSVLWNIQLLAFFCKLVFFLFSSDEVMAWGLVSFTKEYSSFSLLEQTMGILSHEGYEERILQAFREEWYSHVATHEFLTREEYSVLMKKILTEDWYFHEKMSLVYQDGAAFGFMVFLVTHYLNKLFK